MPRSLSVFHLRYQHDVGRRDFGPQCHAAILRDGDLQRQQHPEPYQPGNLVGANPQEVNVNSAGLATVLATDNGAHAITASYGTIAAYLDSDTGWITASTTAPISCPSPTIDMKILVVNNAAANAGAGYADFPAIQQILNYVGTPYEVVDVYGGRRLRSPTAPATGTTRA